MKPNLRAVDNEPSIPIKVLATACVVVGALLIAQGSLRSYLAVVLLYWAVVLRLGAK